MCEQCGTDQSSPRSERRAAAHAAAKPWRVFGVGDEKEKWVPKLVTAADAEVGTGLRDVRRAVGKTLDEAAAASGISKPVLSKVERGERACRVPELGLLAEVYGVTAGLLADAVLGDVKARRQLGLGDASQQ
ncbi:helix-turn-helix domain-containing protein [Mycobacteroides abscessus]|uniref:helix-turn-helix domain-containing protein n=1 Tax=Mycobacteroides abscessus TaxID=36809 RepID=UPI001B7CDE73